MGEVDYKRGFDSGCLQEGIDGWQDFIRDTNISDNSCDIKVKVNVSQVSGRGANEDGAINVFLNIS